MDRVNHDFMLRLFKAGEIADSMDEVCWRYKGLAKYVATFLSAGREQSLALTYLEQALFYSIAAIARNQD